MLHAGALPYSGNCIRISLDTGSPMVRNTDVFGRGVGPIFLDSLTCGGNEADLLSCERESSLGVPSCSHDGDVGVVCPSMLL